MNPQQPEAAGPARVLHHYLEGWNRFWFTPRDPTTLGLMRILTGLVTFYTFAAYSLDLQALIGPHAWLDLETRLETVRDEPTQRGNARWDNAYEPAPPPGDPQQRAFYEEYVRE